jgi:hypothetical protein
MSELKNRRRSDKNKQSAWMIDSKIHPRRHLRKSAYFKAEYDEFMKIKEMYKYYP